VEGGIRRIYNGSKVSIAKKEKLIACANGNMLNPCKCN
jgi:hypothetical protein